LIFVMALSVSAVSMPARAQAPVEAFVQQSIDRGVAVLKDKSLDDAERRAKIGEMLAEVLDTRKMALFMLGNVRETAAASELDVYAEAYRAFSIASYESQLGSYGGQSLKVTGSVERAPGDYIVEAVVMDPALPNNPTPLPVAFRVVAERDGKFAVVAASLNRRHLVGFGAARGVRRLSAPARQQHYSTRRAPAGGDGRLIRTVRRFALISFPGSADTVATLVEELLPSRSLQPYPRRAAPVLSLVHVPRPRPAKRPALPFRAPRPFPPPFQSSRSCSAHQEDRR